MAVDCGLFRRRGDAELGAEFVVHCGRPYTTAQKLPSLEPVEWVVPPGGEVPVAARPRRDRALRIPSPYTLRESRARGGELLSHGRRTVPTRA